MARRKDNPGETTGLPFDGYPSAEYTRKRPKPPPGTLVMRPITRPNGQGGYEIADYHLFVVDNRGELHAILGWELTMAEQNGRCVRDPARLAHLCDSRRHQERAEPVFPPEFLDLVDENGNPVKGAMTTLLKRLTAKMTMPARVKNTLVQREPGEEG